jgi:aldehyde dehydrogenase (NAD+)
MQLLVDLITQPANVSLDLSNLKKVTLELGAKSPSLIFNDANIENAVAQDSQGFLMNTGQVCAATSRVFVQKSVAPKVIEALKGAFTQAEGAFGADPAAASTMLGPLADKAQYDLGVEFIETAKKESSAELAVGGGRIEGHKGSMYSRLSSWTQRRTRRSIGKEIFRPVLNIKTISINMAV